MEWLFSEDYFGYKFPEPQYLGAKYIHRAWIAENIPQNAEVVLDAFGGSQSVAYTIKQMGKTTLTNDFLNFNNKIGQALIENSSTKLSKDDLGILLSENSNPEYYDLMDKVFAGIFFTHEDASFADSFRSNVSKLNNPIKESLALAIMCRSMTRKVTMGHFAHTQALAYAADPKRVQRNRSLIRPLKNLFLSLVPEYNAAVFDNHKQNKSFNENILDLLPKLSGVDVVYFDPPYCNSHADYQSFYHLLETFVEYWKDKDFVNGTHRYEPKRFSGFDKKNEALDSFKKMFHLSQQIPCWILSYNDRSYPDIDTMVSLISPHKNVEIKQKKYSASRGGKGSVAGSSEVLLICTDK